MSTVPKERASATAGHPIKLVERWLTAGERGFIRVQSSLGTGAIWIQEGTLVDSALDRLRGEVALHCMLGLADGSFELHLDPSQRLAALGKTTQQLLSEHREHADEWQASLRALPPLASLLALTNELEELGPMGKRKSFIERLGKPQPLFSLLQGDELSGLSEVRLVRRLLGGGWLKVVGQGVPFDPLSYPPPPVLHSVSTQRPTAAGSPRASGSRTISGFATPVPPALDPGTQKGPGYSRSKTIMGFATPVPPPPDAEAEQGGGPEKTISTLPPPVPVLENKSSSSSAPPDGSESADSAQPLPSGDFDTVAPHTRIGRYEVLTRLGRGGMGTVYLVRLNADGGFSRLFALKVLRSHLASDDHAIQSLLTEARIASRLNHANVVGVVDTGQHGRQPYVVMEYVHGRSLAELLASREGASPRRIVAVLLDALAGLAAVHTATEADGSPLAVIHHDISPHNFLVGVDGVVRLSDFGIAGSRAEDAARINRGKPAYMSPERVRGTHADARSDIFSMGVMMWTSLTGKRLFDADDIDRAAQNVLRAPIPLPSAVSGSPQCLDPVCMKALERSPNHRYQSASEMYEELRRVAAANDLLGSPADTSTWVRSAMGNEANVVYDGGRGNKGRPSHEGATRDGSTLTLPDVDKPSVKRRLLQSAAVVLALGLLLAVLFADLGPSGETEPPESELHEGAPPDTTGAPGSTPGR